MPSVDKSRRLSGKEAAFVDHYIGDARGNATVAARLAGYKDGPGLRVTARRTLTKANIQAAISERLRERAMSADEVIARLAEQARGDVLDVIDLVEGGVDRDKWVKDLAQVARAAVETGAFDTAKLSDVLDQEPTAPGWRIDLEKAKRLGVTHLIRRVGYDRDGRPEVELYDAQSALVQLGRYHGLFLDRHADESPAALLVLRQFLGVQTGDEHGDGAGAGAGAQALGMGAALGVPAGVDALPGEG